MKANRKFFSRATLGLALMACFSFLLGAITAGNIGAPVAQADVTRPPWVNLDGSEDLSKRPPCVQIGTPSGSPVVGKDGKPICVPFEVLDEMKAKVKKGDRPDTTRTYTDEEGNKVEEVVIGDDYIDYRDFLDWDQSATP